LQPVEEEDEAANHGKDEPRNFAYPFYKSDAQRYSHCLKFPLKRIKDVKQHLLRKYCLPDLYCPTCWETFASAVSRDQHLKDRSCQAQPGHSATLEPEGITPDQRKSLDKRNDRNENVDER
jgi:hypothetical protein